VAGDWVAQLLRKFALGFNVIVSCLGALTQQLRCTITMSDLSSAKAQFCAALMELHRSMLRLVAGR